eukprot:TRINITY_DN5192_c0_g1_i2.p1 TRINITY_DN5192_c0_g1~~TRINITY_DN5192_c0_g1_i2.p1  ORF type:complete len:336 (-),score=45.40 TRINITY_DN5192_c0_g1_i2:325-1332(-)
MGTNALAYYYNASNVSVVTDAEGNPIMAYPDDTRPLADCMDYDASNNQECYRNIEWAQEYAKSHPENYPPGSKTVADFQCALYLKGPVNGTNQPGPSWNCTHAPCSALTAPIKMQGGTGGSVGTLYCVQRLTPRPADYQLDALPNCSVTDGSAMSVEYPCLCQGLREQICEPAERCWPAPFYCNKGDKQGQYTLTQDDASGSEREAPAWARAAIVIGLASLVAALVLAGMRCMTLRRGPAKKKRDARSMSRPLPPDVEETSPSVPALEQVPRQLPMYTASRYAVPGPVATTTVPLPAYWPVPAPPAGEAPSTRYLYVVPHWGNLPNIPSVEVRHQ